MSAARPRCGRAASLVTGAGRGAARNAPGPLGYLCHVVSESILTGESMRNNVAVLITAVSSAIATAAGAQATGMPSFNAPYRALQRSEFGGVLIFAFGIGADFRRSRVLDARVSGGLGDAPLTGVSISAVWVH